jgi:hypothetical protein
MKNSAISGRRFIALPALIFLFAFVSCVSNNNNSNQNTGKENNNTAKIAEKTSDDPSDDTEELAARIKLPVTPEDVLWKETSGEKTAANSAVSGDPNAKKLTAVLKFSDVDSEAITQQVQKISPPMNITIDPEEWFPPELIAESETTGDQTLKGKMFDARDFLQEPYKKGRIVKLEQAGYFVLELTTF